MKIKKMYQYMLYILPLALCFSYFPLIKLGENETMYFELSLPLIWLGVFDVIGLFLVVRKYRAEIFTKIFGSVLWWLFPLFVTFSVIWSLNVLRGFLTVSVMWALFFAVLFFYELRDYLDTRFWKIFWRWFFGSALFASAWCIIQCILNVVGVSQGTLLLCDGCVYQMFGFPHPNGFAIEPQFMGNLLIAPILVSGAILVTACPSGTLRVALAKSSCPLGHTVTKIAPLLFFLFLSTLFLTFSRGAIYATVVSLLFFTGFEIFKAKKTERRGKAKQILWGVVVFVLSFIFTLNLQGILAASSPTGDTYFDGVSKVLNQLSLGIIDIREKEPVENSEKTEGKSENVENGVVENSGESNAENVSDNVKSDESIYDGYVAESTDTRVRLFNSALTIWRQDFKTAMVGVGIGGAGQALYNNNLSPAPREIVQNEYASLLLETGLLGVSLFVTLVVMVVKVFLKSKHPGLLLSLLVGYGVSLLFFSGLTNAMQIVLIPGLLVLLA